MGEYIAIEKTSPFEAVLGEQPIKKGLNVTARRVDLTRARRKGLSFGLR